MLTNCPECSHQVSSSASACPNCGFPLRKNIKKRTPMKMRLPNGFGQISEIKNKNLRNPYRVMITDGYKENGKPRQVLLKPTAYFKTYNEAYQALMKYHENGLPSLCTLEDIYKQWYPNYEKTVSSKHAIHVEGWWRYLSKMHKIPINQIHTQSIIDCLNSIDHPSARLSVKTLISQLFDYAIELEKISNNPAKSISKISVDLSRGNVEHHRTFTNNEISILWRNERDFYVQMILFQCYTGFRPSELLDLRIENINFNDWTIIGGSKTKAGKNRMVPIHEKIKHIVRLALRTSKIYLFEIDGKQISYDAYRYKFTQTIKDLKLLTEHTPHDPRVFFITQCKKYNVDEYAIKYMVGHAIQDITEKVYTRREIEWLRSEISKIR